MKGKVTSVNNIEKTYSNYNSYTISSYTITSPNKITKPLNFENKPLISVSYETPIEEVIYALLNEVGRLKKKFEILEKENLLKENALIVQDSLKSIWDNTKDDIWNDI